MESIIIIAIQTKKNLNDLRASLFLYIKNILVDKSDVIYYYSSFSERCCTQYATKATEPTIKPQLMKGVYNVVIKLVC